MAVDHALMDGARPGVVALRFYGWEPACLSLGRNQRARDRYDLEAARRRGVEFVRRPTGGRGVYHHREVTYCVAAPAGTWGGLRPTYRRLNLALRRGLARLGLPVEVAGERKSARAPGPTTRACFRDPLPGEVTAGGRKLVGSAQWRNGGAFLQHGSILLSDEQWMADALRRERAAEDGGGTERGREPTGPDRRMAACLAEFLEPLPEVAGVVAALRAGFEEELCASAEDDALTSAERSRAAELEELYASDDWTWRR